jgi:hypothetical protein
MKKTEMNIIKKILLLIAVLLSQHQSIAQNILINEFMSANSNGLQDEDGEYNDWIEIYNSSSSSVNLFGYYLSDDSTDFFKWTFPDVNLASHNYLIIFASGKNRVSPGENLHTNFKITSSGESIYLLDQSGSLIDSRSAVNLQTNISFGRKPDGATSWYYFEEPTPASANTTNEYSEVAAPPQFSSQGGFYSGGVSLTLTTLTVGAEIHYTTDGSVPTASSDIFTSSININQTSVVRARAFKDGLIQSAVVTNTFLINERATLPVVSISTNPENLWDNDFGIYVFGDSAEADFPYFGANFWQDWEKLAHIELFETNNTTAFTLDAGIKIYGGWSRGYDQKSLAVNFRDVYGASEINYQLFPNINIDKFQEFILRNGGQDWEKTLMRDGMTLSLMEDTELDILAYRPAVLFINGEYWGIQNIREKINENYIAAHHPGIDPNNIDVLQLDGWDPIAGDPNSYFEMIDYIETHNFTNQANYDYIKTQMEIDNFVKYEVAEIYFANTDWPGSNIKYWQPRTPDGIWQWILSDTDFGFGLYDDNAYQHNTLEFATEPNGPPWPNPPWSTLILRKLLPNQEFKYEFINQFADYSNSLFIADTVTARINKFKSAIEDEIPFHKTRWNQSPSEWNGFVDDLIFFAQNRLEPLRNFYVDYFNLSGLADINLNITPQGQGKIVVNNLKVDTYPWTGIYFKDVPITLKAEPEPGFHFIGWTGLTGADSSTAVITLTGDINVTAIFESDTTLAGSIVINEINYNSAPDFDPEDWVEITNTNNSTIDLSGWYFKDDDDAHIFYLPNGTLIQPNDFVILCKDTAAFKTLFPDVENYFGNFSFSLNNDGELIRLFNNNAELVDALTYDDQSPWVTAPDGTGATLVLKDPLLDNSSAENWGASVGHGSPGAANEIATTIDDKTENKLPTEFALEQNYPNPFNPTTKIRFSIPSVTLSLSKGDTYVTLKVFDILGNEVATLVNEEKPAGTYEVNFNASQLSSGIYFYKIQAGIFAQTKKMLLLK